jgi:colanic acid biosynthesis glycosyl transferase WcaI
MNITILSLIFPPETGSARRVGELAEHYAHQGHNVTAVTGFPTYPKGTLYPGHSKKLLLRERLRERLVLTRVWLYTTPRRESTIRRLLHYATFTITSFFGACVSNKPDVIYVVSHPFFLGLTAMLIRLFRGGKVVLDVQDSWPEAPIALGVIRQRRLVGFLVWLEQVVYSGADAIITLSPEMAENLVNRGADAAKLRVVYNWVNLQRYAPMEDSALRRRLGLEGEFVILYAGNIGKPQGLDTVIEAARMTANDAAVRYVIIGDGAEKENLRLLANSYGLTNVLLLPSVSEEEVVTYLGMADALLVHLTSMPHRRGVVPSKVQIYMGIGKPLLLGAVGAPARLVTDAGCGVVFEPDNPQELARAVLRIKAATEPERREMGQMARRYAELHFNMMTQCTRNEAVITTLVRGEMTA